ncbi:CYFA0S36e00452g1_1 [Cyberlindnera fabianii]|uniref:protein disulfide-isomerase n=1 Tax=Cyberlindnera fabianii TaxID=36022 RepID=A0A061BCK1_CYBFA|nr:CYFA0S36e00452g1_1 [Cyberlindnera fabianii]
MKLLTSLLVLVLPALVFASRVIEADSSNFDSIVYGSGKDSLVEFYASWCGHCKKLSPIYDELADVYANTPDVQIVKIECDENRDICSQFGIKGFPTLKLFKKDMSNPVDFDGTRDLDGFIKFIGEHSDAYVYIPKVESNVVQVGDLDFDERLLQSGKNVFVVFTASWCGHCKNLHPDWEKLANVFKDDDNVIIAEVSTTDSPAEELKEKYAISGFPTILTFKANDPHHIPFAAARNLESLTNWVNEIAGTHRAPDGSLTETAGRFPKIDEQIKTLLQQTPDRANEVATELLEQLGEGMDYYRKCLNKIINGEDAFFNKEINRLEGILAKSKLTRDRLDSLQKRLNVLKVFKGEELEAADEE